MIECFLSPSERENPLVDNLSGENRRLLLLFFSSGHQQSTSCPVCVTSTMISHCAEGEPSSV